MMNPPHFELGTRVRIRWHGIEQYATVALASKNDISIALEIDDASVLPLFWDGGQFITIVASVPVEVEKVPHA